MKVKETVVTNGRVILLDEPLSLQTRSDIARLDTIDAQEILFLEDHQLAHGLEEVLRSMVMEPNTLLVFPGNGSNYPRKLSKVCQEFFNTASVEAKRFWTPGTDPEVHAGLIYPERFLILGVKNIVIVDDVISSGLTMRKLYQKNAWRFPGAHWTACVWVSQQLPSGNIRRYNEVSVATLVQREKGNQKVPINSLSTLRSNPEISESYARSHFREPMVFLHLLRKESRL